MPTRISIEDHPIYGTTALGDEQNALWTANAECDALTARAIADRAAGAVATVILTDTADDAALHHARRWAALWRDACAIAWGTRT